MARKQVSGKSIGILPPPTSSFRPAESERWPRIQSAAGKFGLSQLPQLKQISDSGMAVEDILQLFSFLSELPVIQTSLKAGTKELTTLISAYEKDVVKLFDENGQIMYLQIVDYLLNNYQKFGYIRTVAHYSLERLKSTTRDRVKYQKESVYLDEPCPKCRQQKLRSEGDNVVHRADEGGTLKISCESCTYVRFQR